MAEPTVPVPVSLIERIGEHVAREYEGDATLDALVLEVRALLSQPEPTAEPECTCYPAPERLHTTHYGATDPASMREPNPDCPVHFPAAPPSIEDMAPGTRYTAVVQAASWSSLPTERRILMRIENFGRYPNHLSRDQYGNEVANASIDPSTIRDVTPPKDGLVASSR